MNKAKPQMNTNEHRSEVPEIEFDEIEYADACAIVKSASSEEIRQAGCLLNRYLKISGELPGGMFTVRMAKAILFERDAIA